MFSETYFLVNIFNLVNDISKRICNILKIVHEIKMTYL